MTEKQWNPMVPDTEGVAEMNQAAGFLRAWPELRNELGFEKNWPQVAEAADLKQSMEHGAFKALTH